MSALWLIIRPHVFWLVLVAVGLFAFRSWLGEHDARLKADVGVKDAQALIDSLKQQIATRQVETEKQVQVIVKEVAAAKTPSEQVAEINKLAVQPIHAEPVANDPGKVTVDLEPMLQEESECRQNAIKLGSCQQELADRLEIEAQQDKQVDLLKKKPGFWKRLGSGAKKIGWGIAIGAAGVLVARGIH